jgi:hypothetical protein
LPEDSGRPAATAIRSVYSHIEIFVAMSHLIIEAISPYVPNVVFNPDNIPLIVEPNPTKDGIKLV